MKEVKEPEQKPSPPKKPLIFYYCVALIVLMLLNALFFPSVLTVRRSASPRSSRD